LKISGWARPLVRGSAPMVLGQRPNPGPSPKILGSLDGGAEPRLTSGGEAGANGVKFQDRLDLQDGISHPAAKP
jgi:hypothetical protein